MSHTPAKNAVIGINAMASGDCACKPSPAAAPMIAAGAASTPKINWDDVVNIAKNKIGSTDPYSP